MMKSNEIMQAAEVLRRLEHALDAERKMHSRPYIHNGVSIYFQGHSSCGLRELFGASRQEDAEKALIDVLRDMCVRRVDELVAELVSLGVEPPHMERPTHAS